MAYVSLTAAQTDSDSPIDQTLMDTIRTDLDDLDTRVASLFAFGNSGIIDDFLGKDATAPDTAAWVATGGVSTVIAASSHALNLIANGTTSVCRAADSRIGMHMANHEMTTVLQIRLKETFLGTQFFLGWQDRTLADSSTRATTVADCIGLVKGTGTTWKARFANGGSATEVDSLGSPASWGVFRFTTTCSATAGNRTISIKSGATEAALAEISGSPWTNTAQMPVGKYLSPSFAATDAGGNVSIFYIDYVLAYTTTRPLAP